MNLFLVHNRFLKLKPHIGLCIQYLLDYNMVKIVVFFFNFDNLTSIIFYYQLKGRCKLQWLNISKNYTFSESIQDSLK